MGKDGSRWIPCPPALRTPPYVNPSPTRSLITAFLTCCNRSSWNGNKCHEAHKDAPATQASLVRGAPHLQAPRPPAQQLGVQFDNVSGWNPASTIDHAANPSGFKSTSSTTFGAFGAPSPHAPRAVYVTPPRICAPFGTPCVPLFGNLAAPSAHPSSPQVN